MAELLGGEAWVGREAKKERLRQMAESVRFLHVACHGWFDYERPLQSYVETGEDERLTAQEVRPELAITSRAGYIVGLPNGGECCAARR